MHAATCALQQHSSIVVKLKRKHAYVSSLENAPVPRPDGRGPALSCSLCTLHKVVLESFLIPKSKDIAYLLT